MDNFLGFQTKVDFYGCDSEKINSPEFIEKTLLSAATLMNLSVVQSTIHEFSPIGISGVLVIEESHIAIHTWPEYNYVAIDFFTCNKSYLLKEGILWLKEQFSALKIEIKNDNRGNLEITKQYSHTNEN